MIVPAIHPHMSDDTPEPETPSPRSVAETASAEELGIELEKHDPLMEGIDGVTMPDPDDADDETS